jgi:hypothetical protein
VLGYLTVFLLGGSIVTHLLLKRENKRRINGERDSWIVGKTPAELEIMGDKRYVICNLNMVDRLILSRPDFLYTT